MFIFMKIRDCVYQYLRKNAASIISTLVAIYTLLLFFRVLIFPTLVLGPSMNPTISSGQVLFTVSPRYNPLVQIHQGDIVILRCEAAGKKLVKRIIATPGDILEIRNNLVYVNGAPLDEDYILEAMITPDMGPFTLGEDEYFVMGDNRNVSADSRCYGCFSGEDIWGVAYLDWQIPLFVLYVALTLAWCSLVSYLVEKMVSRIPKKSAATCG